MELTPRFLGRAETEWQRLHQEGCFEDDYFFISQLFMENWEPRSTI